MMTWIGSCLTGCTQFVRIAECILHHVLLSVACLKAVYLNTVLFIVYTNDLYDLTPNAVTVKLFADSAKLYSVFSDRLFTVLLNDYL